MRNELKIKNTNKSSLKYSESFEDSKHVKLSDQYDLFIGGKWVKAKKYFNTINPSNEEILSKVAYADEKDVDAAVNSAEKAYNKVWKNLSPKARGKYIFRIARILQEKAREFSVIESMDVGKPIKESRLFDIPTAVSHFFYYAGWADKLEYACHGKEPKSIGVIGQIVPWNFPLLIATWKIAPALACGNTIVIKPSKTTPLTLYKLAEIIQEAEIPEGVVNIITGDGYTGSCIVKHPKVKKIAFTGSTDVGKYIMRTIADTDKKLTLELGGKAANIVFEDASIDDAVEGIIKGIYFNQGEVCCAGSRLLVQESIKDTLIKKLEDRINNLIVGNPLNKNTDVGAINSEEQLNTINELIKSGVDEGATLFQSKCKLPNKGYWCRPSFFSNVAQSHRIANEEIFGPVLAILTFRTPNEAVEKANNTCYGLSAGIWTDKGSKALKIMKKINAGVIWTNTFNKFSPASPFGGYKESGFGREGGIQGIKEYLMSN
ncbi:MAG TPA: aldehyde dehydrogenase family protein [Ignavibacteria bacterium]